MAKPTKQRPTGSAPASPEALSAAASAALAAGRFRDAISAYKDLAKRTPEADWRAGLAAAYAGRARELTTKGMLKEALAIWENRAAVAASGAATDPAAPADAAFHPEHLALLLRLDRIGPLCDLITRAPAQEQPRLRGLLAARLLVDDAALDRIPADDPLRRHLAPARAALAAWCDGGDEQVRAALAEIPFRSSYRDWVQILKALLRLHGPAAGSADEAAALLGRIPADSPFSGIARAAVLATVPAAQLAEALAGAGRHTARFALTLRGWPEPRILLYEELARLGAGPTVEQLVHLLHRQRGILGTDWARERLLRLLVADWPTSARWLKGAAVPTLTQPERALVAARKAEQGDDLGWTLSRWDEYTGHLRAARAAAAQAPERAAALGLRIALCMRRADQVGDILGTVAASKDAEDFDREVAEMVESSLLDDPDHQPTWLRLIGYYQRGGLRKDARRLLDRALARWPRELPVLLAALDLALDGGAFKRAATLARQVLEIDPINTRVRERLVDAHLAHARKQIAARRYDLARKELSQAGDWARGGQGREYLDLTTGILDWIENNNPRPLAAVATRIGGLAGRVALVFALDGCRLEVGSAVKRLRLPAPRTDDPADLREALARLRGRVERDPPAVEARQRLGRTLSAGLAAVFKKATWGVLDPGELTAACETLRRVGLSAVREAAAKAGLRRQPDSPVLQLHLFEARYVDQNRFPSYLDVMPMMRAFQLALDGGDQRTAQRIQQALMAFGYYARPPGNPGGSPGPSPVFDLTDLGDLFDPDDADPTADPRQLPLPGLGGRDRNPTGEPMAEIAAIGQLVREVGLLRALELLDMPASLRRELEDAARLNGEDAVMETFMKLFDTAVDPAMLLDPDDSPPHRRRR